jgi:hypothetical protein
MATASAPAADKDLNGDGIPDLLTVGGTPGLASGLWQATGVMGHSSPTGRVKTPAIDIGANGNGTSTVGAPSDFDGGQAITGRFVSPYVQDVLVYYPSGGNPGSGVLFEGSGDGSVLQTQTTHSLTAGILTDFNGDNPSQLANAYDAAGSGDGYPDLLGINGDSAGGYYLDFYVNPGGVNAYFPVQLTTATPTGGTDWNNWTIATTQLTSGTAMFLWKQSTGQLYLWERIGFTDNGDFTGTLAYTQYQVAADWNRNTALSTLEAVDINGDGVPDLWAVTAAGSVTAYLISDLSTTNAATVRSKNPQKLS